MAGNNCYVAPWNQESDLQQSSNQQPAQPTLDAGVLNELKNISLTLSKLLSRLTPQGVTDFFEGSVDSDGIKLEPLLPDEAWFSLYIKNTGGANNLNFKTNGQSSNSDDPYLAPGESYAFDPRVNIIKSIQLYSLSGTDYKVICAK